MRDIDTIVAEGKGKGSKKARVPVKVGQVYRNWDPRNRDQADGTIFAARFKVLRILLNDKAEVENIDGTVFAARRLIRLDRLSNPSQYKLLQDS